MALPKAVILASLLCVLQLTSFGQSGCPGFTPGNVGNSNIVVNFYTSTGTLVSSCPCQLVGAGIKCGGCTPSIGTWFYCTFSILGISVTCYTDAILGVHWGDISARKKDGVVTLNWSTLMEIDNEKFFIERSADGQKAEVLGWVEGSGNSNSKLNYSYIDFNADPELPYYRIVQQDFDGKVDYTDWYLPEEQSQDVLVNIIPNPSNGDFSIFLTKDEQEASLLIMDHTGREVMTASLSGGINKLKTDLPAGHYVGWLITKTEKKKIELSIY